MNATTAETVALGLSSPTLIEELGALADGLIMHGERMLVGMAIGEIVRLQRTTGRPDDVRSYAVTLCADGTEPVSVRDALLPLDHVRDDGAACHTPSDEIGYASRWRHPSRAELAAYLASRR